VRRILLVSAATALLLSACGSSDAGSSDGSLADVKVSSSKSPDVTVAKGFAVDKTSSKVLTEGSGETVAAGDSVKVNYVAVNGRTGKQFDTSFTTGTPYTVTLTDGKILPGFIKGLEGRTIGSRVLVAISPKDGFGQAQSQLDIKANDTLVFLFDIVSKVPSSVTGKARSTPKNYPKLEVDAKNIPTAFVKKSTTDPKKDAAESSFVIIDGTGPEVTAGQTITAQYFGQIYPGGTTFDESYSKDVLTKPLTGLYQCWQDQLVGKKVGSRVIIVCPAAVGQGVDAEPEGTPIKKGDTLLFSVDLLDAY
jgi:peptidylprolyl isomerase